MARRPWSVIFFSFPLLVAVACAYEGHKHVGHFSVGKAYLRLMRDVILNSIYDPQPWKRDGSIRPESEGPYSAYSMAGERRLDNVHDIIIAVTKAKIPGDIMETGCWKGGAMFYAAAVLLVCNELGPREVYMADSFEGIPKPQKGELAIGVDKTAYLKNLGDDNSPQLVTQRAERLGLPLDHLHTVQGFFRDSLPPFVEDKGTDWRLAVLRLDGDTYFSTMESLDPLYAHVSTGGYIIVDDFMDWRGCFEAILEFRKRNSITDPLVTVHHASAVSGEVMRGVYWRKGGDPCEPQGHQLQLWDALDTDLPAIYYTESHVKTFEQAKNDFFSPNASDPLYKCTPALSPPDRGLSSQDLPRL